MTHTCIHAYIQYMHTYNMLVLNITTIIIYCSPATLVTRLLQEETARDCKRLPETGGRLMETGGDWRRLVETAGGDCQRLGETRGDWRRLPETGRD